MPTTEIPTKAIAYFNRGQSENPRYWSRFGIPPNFQDAVVADLGSGFGSLCIDIAKAGARRVIGYELNPDLVRVATQNLHQNYPEFRDRVEFRCQDIQQESGEAFDYFVSKDAFEHVLNLDQVLSAMKSRLKDGGRIYAGFGPIWNSPFGDHGRVKVPIPWGHVIFTERYLIQRLNRLNPENEIVNSIHNLGLNKLSLQDYRDIFNQSGLSIVAFHVNASERPISRIFSVIRKIPLVEEYFSHNIYCVLEKN